jgi:carbonic anhydrase
MTQPPADDLELKRRIQDAIRRGASMEDIADLHPAEVTSPEDAIEALKDGNARFFSGKTTHSEIDANQRRAQIMGQAPFAAVLACSDSRVPVEIVFDQGLGHLFVVRVAGNVLGDMELGTLEYATEHLGVQLIVILGHEGCGAVAAALLSEKQLAAEPPNLRKLIAQIQPCLQDMPPIRDKKARMREAVLHNIRRQVNLLRQQPVIQAAEGRRQIRVIGAYYEIGSGAVDFLIEEEELCP